MINAEIHNGYRRVPSVLLSPVAVNRENVKTTVIADGFWSTAQVCVGRFAAECRRTGIS